MKSMHTTQYVALLIGILLAVASTLLVGCQFQAEETGEPSLRIRSAELVERLGTDAAPLVLDVRTIEEYNNGHIPGAVNIPHYLLGERLDEVLAFKDQEVVVLCEVGVRSREAQQYLQRQGFSQVKHLTGDMVWWRMKRLPQSR